MYTGGGTVLRGCWRALITASFVQVFCISSTDLFNSWLV